MMRGLKTTALIALGAALSLSMPLISQAQSRSVGFAPGRTAMSFRSPSARAPVNSGNRFAAGNPVGARAPRIGTPLYPNFAPIPFGSRAVPGLGFDYEHLVAVAPPRRDRFGHLRSGRLITPVFFGGLPYYGDPYYGDAYYGDDTGYDGAGLEPQPPPLQPEMYVPQPPQYDPQFNSQFNPGREPASAPQVSNAAPEAVPDAGELILVRRDGQVAMAVGFTTAGGRLTYITREGTRRSFSLSELDKDATLQMNEANGTTLTLPN